MHIQITAQKCEKKKDISLFSNKVESLVKSVM